jgi:hypothetical protein
MAGWASLAVGVSCLPSNLYTYYYWQHHRMDYPSIVTPEGLVRDAAMSMRLAAITIVVGAVIVIVRGHRSADPSSKSSSP